MDDKKLALELAKLAFEMAQKGQKMWEAMDMQLKRENGEFHIPSNVAYSIYKEAMDGWEECMRISNEKLQEITS